jgi:hypothetical protein
VVNPQILDRLDATVAVRQLVDCGHGELVKNPVEVAQRTGPIVLKEQPDDAKKEVGVGPRTPAFPLVA